MKTGSMAGFAVALVLWTLAVLSAVALMLAASVGTETRASQEGWNDLQAELLAKSGQEVATYLQSRQIATPKEDLAGLPVQPVVGGLSYRVAFEAGTVDLILEGENGKADLAAAGEEFITNFFTAWTGDPQRGREIAASIGDWMDPDDEPRPLGAESAAYIPAGYAPRNAGLGAADLGLIKGLRHEDFAPSIVDSNDGVNVRRPLTSVLAAVAAGTRINPNYASEPVLESIPGMTPGLLRSILAARRSSIFRSAEDFQERLAVPPDSPILTRLVFNRGAAQSVTTLAHLHDSQRLYSERRTRWAIVGTNRVVSLIEHGLPAN